MQTRLIFLVGACALALGLPAAAQATTTVSLSPDGQVLTLAGDGTTSTLDVFPHTESGDASYIQVTSYFDPFAGGSSADYLQAGAGCVENDPPGGSTVYVRCGPTSPTLRRITGTLGGEDDYFQNFVVFPGGVTLDGGEGNDSLDAWSGTSPASITYTADLTGGEGVDSLGGDGGNDILDGGRGIDSLSGAGGTDQVSGGPDGDTLNGGPGLDALQGGDGNDGLSGGDGNDDLDGQGGADDLVGGANNDSLDGGADNDRFEAAASASAPTDGTDTIVGGSGVDSVGYQSELFALTLLTLDDVANDGEANPSSGASIEQDDVRSDVENLTTANYSAGSRTTVIGNDANNAINGFGEANNLTGGGGNDYINATCYPSCAFGEGADVVSGGPGNDEIRTATGADEIDGGPGADEIYSDNCSSFTCSQPDKIEVVDGERDLVYCGGGGDTVRADPVDVLQMCTNVTIVGGPGGQTGGTGQPSGGTQQPATQQPVVQAAPNCRVPSLRRLSLRAAKRRLRRAGCKLGQVRRPRRGSKRGLVVSKQSRRAGRMVPRSTKVNVTLVRPSKKRRRG